MLDNEHLDVYLDKILKAFSIVMQEVYIPD